MTDPTPRQPWRGEAPKIVETYGQQYVRKPWECPSSAVPGLNHHGDRHCGLCGAPMFWTCASGKHESPLWAKFCTTCGRERSAS